MMLSKAIKGLALLTCFYPVRWTVRCLPWRWALKMGTLLGSLHALLITDQLKRWIREGIQTAWPDELPKAELNQLVQCNLVTRYKYLIDSFFYQNLDEVLIERVVPTIEGRCYLDQALSNGRSAILLASHFGSFGMLIAGLSFRGYRLQQILTLTPQSPYRTWRWVERAIMKAKLHCWQHERVGFTFWRPGMYLRPFYRKLLAGEVLVLYGDGARGRQFTQVDFLGYPLSLSVGPFRIAAKLQVALIPAFVIRQADDSHRIILEKPIMLKDDHPSSIQQAVSHYASLLAHYVRIYPDHWFTWARLRRALKEDSPVLEFSTGEVDLPNLYFYTAEK